MQSKDAMPVPTFGIHDRCVSRSPMPHRLALACCAAMLLSLPPAMAQDAAQQAAEQDAPTSAQDATDLDTVRVTGIRRAIATSVETKSESSSIVEAISSEDIGKLPDISIADSISRLPA